MALDLQGQILNGQWNIRQDVMVNARNFLQVAGMINRPERTEARMIDSIISCIIVCVHSPTKSDTFFSFLLIQLGSVREVGVLLFSKGTKYYTPEDWKKGPGPRR